MARKTKRNLVATIIIIVLLLYATLNWFLPGLISGIGFVKGFLKPSTKQEVVGENPSLAPPVFNIPYEATNSAKIDIKGFATGSKVKLYLDDQLKDTVETREDGSFIFKDIELSLGTNNIYGKTVDEKDQMSLASKTIKLIYDNEKPKLSISEPEDGKVIKGDKKVKISGQTDPGAEVYINGNRVIINSDGNFSSDQPLNDGDNNFTIRAADQASNFTEVSRKVIFQP